MFAALVQIKVLVIGVVQNERYVFSFSNEFGFITIIISSRSIDTHPVGVSVKKSMHWINQMHMRMI